MIVLHNEVNGLQLDSGSPAGHLQGALAIQIGRVLVREIWRGYVTTVGSIMGYVANVCDFSLWRGRTKYFGLYH